MKPAGIVTVLGVDTTVLAVGILLIAASREFLRHPHFPLREMIPFLAFASVVLVGTMMSNLGDYQVLKTRDFFFITSVIVVCIPVLIRGVGDLRGLVFMWLLVGSAAAGTVLLAGGSDTLLGRAGIGEATLGPAYLAAAGLVAGVASLGERIIHWLATVPVIGLTGLAVVSIGSRGPLLGAIVGVAAWMLMGTERVRLRRTLLAGLALVAAFLFGVLAASDASLNHLFLYEDPARQRLWAIARLAFLEHPVLGLGWGDYTTVASFSNPYPHNAVLEVAAELGLVGIVAFISLLFAGARRTWRRRTTGEVRVLGAVAVVALIGQQFSSDLTNRFFWIALIPTLLFGSVRRKQGPSVVMPFGSH
jgi:O-antigen ligase